MENIWYWILGLYFVPMIINMIVSYKEDKTETIGDLLNNWGLFFIPIVNIFVTICTPAYYIDKLYSDRISSWWERFKNIRIR